MDKQLEDRKAMEEASRLYRPRLPSLENNETLNKMLPMAPQDGPPLPRILKLKWPWVKK